MISMTWPQYLRGECKFNGKIVSMTRGQTELLSVLLMNRGRLVTREQLVEAVWPDADTQPDTALWIILVHVYQLRKRLSPASIVNNHGIGYIIP